MGYWYECKSCGAYRITDEEEPIIPLPFYNPHRSACPNCGREVKGYEMERTPSILDD